MPVVSKEPVIVVVLLRTVTPSTVRDPSVEMFPAAVIVTPEFP